MHERPDVVKHRGAHCERMAKRELRQHLWMQVTKQEDEKLKAEHPDMQEGHPHEDAKGTAMVPACLG